MFFFHFSSIFLLSHFSFVSFVDLLFKILTIFMSISMLFNSF